jgi:hypothetical protein
MAAPSSSNGSAPPGMIPADWPVQAADTVVDVIGKVRDKTTKPALIAARALVYGLVAAVVAGIALVLFLVVLIRVLDNYVPGPVWWIYLGFSVLFTLAGIVLIRKANAPVEPSTH